MIIRPAENLRGEIKLPGDKSISHRAAMFASMAVGQTRIDNFSASADCESTLECLTKLGVDLKRDGASVIVSGVGKTGLQPAVESLDCGNSGTAMRLFAGLLAGQRFNSVLVGDDSLQSRPMKRVIEPLGAMGAVIESNSGRAPLTIHGHNPLTACEHTLEVASAQVKSSILLAGLNADGQTSVAEPVPTRDHTERMLRWFGVDVRESRVDGGKMIAVNGDCRLSANDLMVPADISASAFFLTAAACLNDSDILIRNVGLNPTRSAVVGVLRRLGADIRLSNQQEQNNEPVGDIRIFGGLGKATETVIRGAVIANLIDELPILAVFGTQIEGGLEIRDAGELRVKESDRIATVVENLRRMGADVEEFDDGFRVGKSKLIGAKVDSFGDHRIAMAFSVAGLLADGETEINGAECADVSFPRFFEELESVINYK